MCLDSAVALILLRTIRNQRESPLLRLPAELRNKVYTYVLGGREIELCCNESCGCGGRRRYGRVPRGKQGPVSHYPRSLLALLETCHQVHGEARLLPFSSNMFLATALDWKELIAEHFSDERKNAIQAIGVQIYGYSGDQVMDEFADSDLFNHLAMLSNLKVICLLLRRAIQQDQREEVENRIRSEWAKVNGRQPVKFELGLLP